MNLNELLLNSTENDMEFMPIVPLGEVEMDDEEKGKLSKEIPIIALRNTVLFPNVVLPITVAREKSLKAIEEAVKSNGMIGVVAQMDSVNEDPGFADIYKVGTIAKIVKQLKMPDGNTTLFIMGKLRFEIESEIQEDPFLKASVKYLDDDFPKEDKEFDAMVGTVKDLAEKIINLSPNMPSETGMVLRNIENFSFLIHFIASNLETKIKNKQGLLEESDIKKRTGSLIDLLQERYFLHKALFSGIHANVIDACGAITSIIVKTIPNQVPISSSLVAF